MAVHAQWEVRRSEFNHDWLKNRYLNSLNAFVKRLEASAVDSERIAEFVTQDLPQWDERRLHATDLVASFENEMSPRTLFHQPPLNQVDDNTKQWLGSLAHWLWLSRCDVRTSLERIRVATDRVDKLYQGLSNGVVRYDVAPEDLIERLTDFCKFRDALVQLAETISALPHRVMVT